MTRIYLFPGQGSQKLGIGADLFPRFPNEVSIADAELGYSIEELCLRDPAQQLNRTEFTQPALYVVNALSFLARLADTGELPHFVAGHSLGEFSALFAAGVFDFRTGVQLVKRRGALMSEARGGAMAAVIGLDEGQIRDAFAKAGVSSIDIANLNCPGQIVISGAEADFGPAEAVLQGAGARLVQRLKVSGAFHSRYMAPARETFARFLEGFAFNPPRIPVIANVTARPYGEGEARDLLARQLTSPVRWIETIQWLKAQPEPNFVEVGPGNVLTGLLRRF